jgi:hypothetical protein
MTTREIEQHVKILGWLHIVGHALFLVIGLFIFFLLIGIGAVSGEAEAMGVLTIVGIFVGGIMLVLALPGLAAGYGLLKRRSWGRLLAIVVGALNLPNFPLGTVVGVYTLYVLLQNEASAYFAGEKIV